MDEDNTSTNEAPQAVDTPESDPILDVLSDTEDVTPDESIEEAPAEVEETPEDKESETETPPEVEQPIEETEEVEAPVDPKEEARRRFEERQLAKLESQKRVQEVTQEHIKGAETDDDLRIRTLEADNYARRVEQNENTLINEFETVKLNPDLQIFNPDNKEAFNEKAYDKAMRDYNAGYVDFDQNGNLIGIKGSLIEHLKETAELLQGAVKSGAVQQVKASKKMQTNADSKPAATPKETVKDPILEILSSD